MDLNGSETGLLLNSVANNPWVIPVIQQPRFMPALANSSPTSKTFTQQHPLPLCQSIPSLLAMGIKLSLLH